MNQPPFTFSCMKTISHCLGIDYFRAVMSQKLKDKKLPDSFYRNYFNAEKHSDLDALCECGYAVRQEHLKMNYYHITELGIEKFRKQFAEQAIYTPVKDRDINWLRNRINFYCDFYGYNFCKNNSDHVIEYAKKYFVDKEYVSHTTKDVLLQFKTELKKLVKNVEVSTSSPIENECVALAGEIA